MFKIKIKILITTQVSTLFENLNHDESKEIILEPFEESDSIDFIMNNLNRQKLVKNADEAKELLDLFCLP